MISTVKGKGAGIAVARGALPTSWQKILVPICLHKIAYACKCGRLILRKIIDNVHTKC